MTGAREYGDALIASSSSVTRKLHGIGPHLFLAIALTLGKKKR